MEASRGFFARIVASWRGLASEQRLAVFAAVLLLATLFLPWYQKSYFDTGKRLPAQDSLNGFGSADFTLASVVLVALGVLFMMFARGEGRGFHLPGGDGLVIMIAGGWAALLIFYRVLDHPDPSDNGTTIGIQWGVFVAFLAAAFLVYAGVRIRTAHRPEPPLPAADSPGPLPDDRDRPPRRRPSAARDEAWTAVEPLRGPADADAPTPVAPKRPTPTPSPPPAGEESTEIVPRRRRRRPRVIPPSDDDGGPSQLSFDEPESRRLPER